MPQILLSTPLDTKRNKMSKKVWFNTQVQTSDHNTLPLLCYKVVVENSKSQGSKLMSDLMDITFKELAYLKHV